MPEEKKVIKSNTYLSVELNDKNFSLLLPEEVKLTEVMEVLHILVHQVRASYDAQIESTKIKEESSEEEEKVSKNKE